MKDLFVDVATGEVIETQTSPESIAEAKALQEQLAAEQAERDNARKAVLEKLGLTEQEAAVLLG